MTKRIVLTYTTGAYKGLRQIVGTDDQFREQLNQTNLPDFCPEVQFLDHAAAVNLIRATPRFIEYRELIVPALSGARSFHPSQV